MSTQSILERARARRAQEAERALETPHPAIPSVLPSESEPASSPNPFATAFPPSHSLGQNNQPTRLSQLRNFGEKALKKVKLDTDCEAEFRTYIETPNQDERNVMQFLHTLRLESLLNKSLQTHISTWKSSPALLRTMRKFIWAMLLLPNVAYYAGTNENTIIEAMRKSNIPDLPPVDSIECEGLVKDVAREYSVQRSTFNTQVSETLPDKKVDIATLSAALVAHSEHVNATLEFWPKVDKELFNLRAGGSGDLVTALQIIYEDDGQTHGDPAKYKHKTGDGVGQGSPSWLRNLSSLVPHIQRFSRRQGTKRKRPADFDMPTNDDDPETPRAQPDDDTEDPEPAGGNVTD
ncbi:hypothetical protein DFH08DRAFT_966542 [Mycena albidolilacea]|uniref:Uncharacterized protein n=1 Tax=Mycena albidolilacea TaxID=1033008 RepID=A0AAD6ZP02_9AGAR|nr:hypothetical protein DFH08DRAFT_966542 [Mycena albidolilacea]